MGKVTTGTLFLRAVAESLLIRKQIGFVLILLTLLSCSTSSLRGDRPRGVYHLVKTGETLPVIARAYNVPLQDLAEMNNIRNPEKIEAGSVIFIPDANQAVDDVLAAARHTASPSARPEAVTPKAKPRTSAETPPPRKDAAKKEKTGEVGNRREKTPAEEMAMDRAALLHAAEQDAASRRSVGKTESTESNPPRAKKVDTKSDTKTDTKTEVLQVDGKRFIWPVKGKVVSKFGPESITADYNGKKVETARIMNNSIRIAANAGTPVVAAGDGKVIYSMTLEKFGNTIIIEHDDNFKTVYYDLGKRVVETLQNVRKGQPIAYLAGEGKTAQGEAVMSFEIRQKNKPRNPLFFLP